MKLFGKWLLATVCGVGLAVVGAGWGNGGVTVHADQVAPSTENIIVHKTMYDQKDQATFANSKNQIQNDGTVKTLPNGLTNYNPTTMGKVEFTIYDITDAVNAHYTDGKGLVNFAESQTTTAQNRVNEVVAAIKANETGSAYTSGSKVQKIATQAINASGTTTFSGLKAYDTSKPQKYHYYAIVETKTPKGFVNQKADPMVVVAPYTNPAGTSYLTDINLYPKNNTKKLTFKLTKYQVLNAGADGKVSDRSTLAGAKFQAYTGTAGSGTAIGSPVTTDSNGVINIDNVIMGHYYLVELASSNVSADGSAGTNLLLSPLAMNNSNNKLQFTVDENGATSDDLQGQLNNYQRPNITKALTNGIGSTGSLHTGDIAKFTSKLTVPRNVLGSAATVGATGKLTQSLPFHKLYAIDVPGTYLKDVPSLRNLTVKTPDGTTLTAGTDYKVIEGPNSWAIDLITQNLSAKDQAATKTSVNSVGDFKTLLNAKSSGQVTAAVAKAAGQNLTITYDQVVRDDAPTDTSLLNTITLGWNDGSGQDNTITKQGKTVTYGIHFVKESTGFMGTGISGKKLQGAEFAVEDEATGKWFNGFVKDSKTGESTAQWVSSYQDVTTGKLTSDKNGAFGLTGFTEGKYKLRETKAPAGYQLMEETSEFTIGANTEATTAKTPIVIKNTEKTLLPLTGSQTVLFERTALFVIVAVIGLGGFEISKLIKKRQNA